MLKGGCYIKPNPDDCSIIITTNMAVNARMCIRIIPLASETLSVSLFPLISGSVMTGVRRCNS